jgi:hypothetical protein
VISDSDSYGNLAQFNIGRMVEAENIVFIVNIYLCFEDSAIYSDYGKVNDYSEVRQRGYNPAPATIRSVLLRREILQGPTLCSYREGRIESPRLIRDRQTGQCDCPETVGDVIKSK